MTPLVAHVGHWLVETLYVMPVVVIVVWISVKALLDRRRERREGTTGPPPAATD
jgi:hypothetical protein